MPISPNTTHPSIMSPLKQWYALRVRGNKVEKIRDLIASSFKKHQAEELLDDIIPLFTRSYAVKKGKKVMNKRCMPYILLNINIEDKRAIPILRDIDGIYGFVGTTSWSSNQLPAPIPLEEIDRMRGKMVRDDAMEGEIVQEFVEGEDVDIIDGPFRDKTVTIASVNPARKRVKATIKCLGISTVLDLSYNQITKTLS